MDTNWATHQPIGASGSTIFGQVCCTYALDYHIDSCRGEITKFSPRRSPRWHASHWTLTHRLDDALLLCAFRAFCRMKSSRRYSAASPHCRRRHTTWLHTPCSTTDSRDALNESWRKMHESIGDDLVDSDDPAVAMHTSTDATFSNFGRIIGVVDMREPLIRTEGCTPAYRP